MSRTVSSAAAQSLFASQTDEVWVMLIEISHVDMTTVRITSDTVDTVHNSNTYTPYPFEMAIPDDTPNSMPTVELSIDNVDRSLVDEIRTLSSSPDIKLTFVLADTPNTIEAGPFVLQLLNASYDALKITGSLVYQDILREPYPADRYNPANFPGLF